jgi:hypothetical protein
MHVLRLRLGIEILRLPILVIPHLHLGPVREVHVEDEGVAPEHVEQEQIGPQVAVALIE